MVQGPKGFRYPTEFSEQGLVIRLRRVVHQDYHHPLIDQGPVYVVPCHSDGASVVSVIVPLLRIRPRPVASLSIPRLFLLILRLLITSSFFYPSLFPFPCSSLPSSSVDSTPEAG